MNELRNVRLTKMYLVTSITECHADAMHHVTIHNIPLGRSCSPTGSCVGGGCIKVTRMFYPHVRTSNSLNGMT